MASSARIDELRKKFDENPRRYFAPLANEYRKSGDLEQAILICQEYLPQQPGHMSGHIVYGQALYELGRHEEAKAVFETALTLDPENLIALKHLGDIARNAGDTRGARAWYQRVLEADPRNEEIAQIMLSLLSLPEGTPAIGIPVMPAHGHEEPSIVEEPPEVEPEPVAETHPVVLEEAVAEPVVPPPALPVERAAAPTPIQVLAVAPTTASPPPPPTPPAPPAAVESVEAPHEQEHELLDIEDFSMGGTPRFTSAQADTPGGLHITMSDGSVIDRARDDAAELRGPATPEAPVDLPLAAGDEPLEDLAFASDLGFASTEPEMKPGVEATTLDAMPGDASIADAASNDSPSFGRPSDQTPAEPALELVDDIKLGLTDEPAATVPTEASLSGLETFDEGVVAGASEAGPPQLETESFFELPNPRASEAPELSAPELPVAELSAPELPAPEPSGAPIDAGHGDTEIAEAEPDEAPASSAAVATAQSGQAFVTETMAELYLEQGHLDSALTIYRTLVAQRPDDPHLRDRMRAIEDRAYGHEPEPDEAQPAPSTPMQAVQHPTIREFLNRLLLTATDSIAFPAAWSTTPLSSDRVLPGEAEESSEAGGRLASENGGGPHSAPATPSDTVSGSIDALFAGASSGGAKSTRAESAASAIAEALAPGAEDAAAEPEPIQGAPTVRAADELSLDHVFKSNAGPRASSDGEGFSFSQFFAEEPKAGQSGAAGSAPGAAAGSGAAPRPEAAGPGPGAGGGDDIAQFNAWLDGLKKKA